ncbi:hypothetical protein PIB30_088085 [Stylosanthes scabra]|uniref:Putative plant transposon protein domain-containing protein n=1 Tax=Stylosanthes scabra TaxID=79078 RepID=A0ABU6QU92_9FABA|nr:hypothetical protein [Stylosanthes scabra]
MAADEVLDAHYFRTLFNQRLHEEMDCRKKIIPEVGFNLTDEEYPEIGEEFYANVARTEEQMEGRDTHPYTSYVRGVEIDFSPENIRRVMRFKENTPGAQHNYHHRRPTNEELDEVLRDLCVQGATWKMGKVARAMLIHSIMRGDEIKAEEITADNIILITQGLGGKGKLGFPSTIYKLCRTAKVRINREYRGYEECDEGRFITSEVMETVKIPQIVLGQHIEHNDDQDELMPQFMP